LKNKVAQALSLLLVQSYSLPPPYTLLATLLSLTRDSAGALRPASTDLVLRIMHDLSLTLGSDTMLRAVRSRERRARDRAVRDEIRAHNAAAIAQMLWATVQESLGNVGSGRWPDNTAEEITEQAVRVVGDYVCESAYRACTSPHLTHPCSMDRHLAHGHAGDGADSVHAAAALITRTTQRGRRVPVRSDDKGHACAGQD
jgi:hypothetical protein